MDDRDPATGIRWAPGTAEIDSDGAIVRWTEAAEQILGWPPEQVIGRTAAGLVIPQEHWAAHRQRLGRFIETGAGSVFAECFELTAYHADGRELPVEMTIAVVASDGHLASHVFFTDVSARKQPERRLQEMRRQRDYLDTLVNSMHEGLLLTKDGEITDVNPAMCDLVSYAREELVGMRVPYAFWAPEAMDVINAYRARVASASGPCGLETCYVRRDGTRIDVAITTVPTAPVSNEPLGYLSTVRDITQQNRDRAELEQLATRDALTGLHNRHAFRQRLRDEIARARRHGGSLSLAILDIDFFKDINDRYGHPVGDQVLREVAHRVEGLVRESEHFARIGGEEFAWILPDATADGAFAAAERARHSINTTPFSGVGTVTLSAGVCQLSAVDNQDTVYQRADAALYAAKQQGRDRTVLDDAGAAVGGVYPAIG